ncbi:intracellular chloride channel [Aureococcus anophagefferens]|nr:intracellular chloride channel [Aureococcus anophagefferens]
MGAGATKGINPPKGVAFEEAALPFVGLRASQLRALRTAFGEYAQGYSVELDEFRAVVRPVVGAAAADAAFALLKGGIRARRTTRPRALEGALKAAPEFAAWILALSAAASDVVVARATATAPAPAPSRARATRRRASTGAARREGSSFTVLDGCYVMYGGVDEQDANACTSDVHVVSEFPAVLCTPRCAAAPTRTTRLRATPSRGEARGMSNDGPGLVVVYGGAADAGAAALLGDLWVLAFSLKTIAAWSAVVLLFGGLTKPKDAAAAAAVVHTVEVAAGASSVDPYVATASAMPCAVADASLAPPSRRSGVVCAVLGNERKVLAFGGFDGRLRRAHSDVWELAMDEETGGTWARLHDGVASNYVAGSMDRPKVPALAAFTKRHLAVLSESDDGDRLDELLSVSVREAPGAGAEEEDEYREAGALESELAVVKASKDVVDQRVSYAHGAEVLCVAAAGGICASGDSAGAVALWRGGSLEVLARADDVFGASKPASLVAFAPGGAGALLADAIGPAPAPDDEAEDASTKLFEPTYVPEVREAPPVDLLDAPKPSVALRCVASLDGCAEPFAVTSLDFAAGAAALLVASADGTAREFALPLEAGGAIGDGARYATGPGPAGHAVATHPRGKAEAATAGGVFEGLVKLWDTEKHKVAGELSYGSSAATAVDYSPTARTLAFGTAAGAVVLAKRKPFELATVICEPGAGAPVAAVAWAPEGPSLAVATEAGAVDVYAFKDGAWRKVAASPPGPEPLLAVDFSADGAFLRAATPSGVSYFAAPGADDEPAADDAGEGDDEAEAPKKKKAAPKEYVVKECKVAAPDDVAAVDWAAKAAAPAESLDALQGAVEPPAEDEEDEDDDDAPKKAKVEPPPAVRPAPSGVRVTLKRPGGGHAPSAGRLVARRRHGGAYEVDDEEAPAHDDDLDWESTITFMVDRETTRATRLGAAKRHRPFRGSVQVPRMPLDHRYGYGYDAVLALRHDDDADGGRLSAKAREIVKKLHGGGVETRLERASRGRKLDWIVPLCPAAVERRITRGAEGIKPRTLHHDPKLTHGRGPYVLIHGKYDTDEGLQALYDAPRGCAHLFECYFGERLALYFAFVNHLALWCGFSAAAGVATTAAMYWENTIADRARKHSRILPVFTFFQCCWAVLMLEFWKRKECRMALSWGTLGLDEAVPNRPAFRGATRPSLVDGTPEIHYPKSKRNRKGVASFVTVFLLVVLVVAAASSVIWVRVSVQTIFRPNRGLYVAAGASVLNTAQIEVMNYGVTIATKLNAWENHRTDVEYMNNLVLKLVSFFFFNYNIPLLYARSSSSSRAARAAAAARRRRGVGAEVDFDLSASDDIDDNIGDMTVLAIRFSFITLFITALPCLTALAWFANHYEGTNDLKKFLFYKRREWPAVAWSVGSWLLVFQLITACAVTTNAACIFYTVRWEPFAVEGGLRPNQRSFGFFLVQYIVFTLMVGLMIVVPDQPEDVEIQLKRQRFLVSKLIDQTPDEMDSDSDDGGDDVDDDDVEAPLRLLAPETPSYALRGGAPPPPVFSEALAKREPRDAAARVFEDLKNDDGRLDGAILESVLGHRAPGRDVGPLLDDYLQAEPHTVANFKSLLRAASALGGDDASDDDADDARTTATRRRRRRRRRARSTTRGTTPPSRPTSTRSIATRGGRAAADLGQIRTLNDPALRATGRRRTRTAAIFDGADDSDDDDEAVPPP